MNRPMFAGSVQPTPDSVGVGITSGLVPDQSAEQSFAQVSGSMGNMLNEIDNAKDTEGIINAMRGNDASIEERYNELAGYVGEKDAKQTPESVLTLVQPTFSMVDTLKQSAPAGGIADANIGEASPMSSPGMDEAVNRMMQGEQPVFRQAGSPPTGENILPYLSNTLNYQPLGFGDVEEAADFFMQRNQPRFAKQQELIDSLDLKTRMDQLNPYLAKPKTTQELLKEYQGLLGGGDKDASAAQIYLSLAKAGADIASSPKGLLGAVVEAGGAIAPEISKIAADQSEKERTLKLAAIQEKKELDKLIQTQNLELATKTLDTRKELQSALLKDLAQTERFAIEQGMNLTKENLKYINDARKENFIANNGYGKLGTETYAKIITDEKTGKKSLDLIPVRMTDTGPKYYQGNQLVDIPPGYAPYQKGMEQFKDLKPNLGDFKQTSLLIPITEKMRDAGVIDNGSGMVEVPGFYTDKGGHYISIKGGDLKLAPEGYMLGKMTDILKIADPDASGRVRVTNRLNGKSWISRVVDPKNGVETRIGPTLQNLDNRARYQEIPRDDGSGIVDRVLISGDPFIRQVPSDSENVRDYLAPGEISNTARRINESNKLLSMYDEYKKAAMEAVGWRGSLKQWSNAVLAPFFNDPSVKFHATEAAKVKLIQLGRQLVKSTALSERYAVAEQQLIEQKLGQQDADFWKNPELAATKIAEIMREVENFRNKDLAMLNGDSVMYQRDRKPSGTINDPFIFSMKNNEGVPFHYDAFMNAVNAIGEGKEELYKNGYDKLYIYLTQEEAEARGIKAPPEGITINAKRLLGK